MQKKKNISAVLPKQKPVAITTEQVIPKKPVRLLDAIISVCVFAIFFGLPIFFTGLSFQGIVFEKHLYFYFWILLAISAWMIKAVRVGELRVRRTPFDFLIAGFLAVFLISSVFSVDRWHSFWGSFGDPSRGLVNMLALSAAYWLITSHFNWKKLVRVIVPALVASHFILVAWEVMALLDISWLPQQIRAYSPVSLTGSLSGLAIYLSSMIPVLLAVCGRLMMSTFPVILKWILFALTAASLLAGLFLLAGLYTFVSWIGWAALLLGLVIFIAYHLLNASSSERSMSMWVPMAVFVIVMTLMLSGKFFSFVRITLPAEVSLNYPFSREIAWESLRHKTLFGSGPATYGYNFSLYRPREFNQNMLSSLRFNQGTGLFLESISTLGAAGTFMLVVGVLAWISLGIYVLSRGGKRVGSYTIGFFSAVIIMLASLLALKAEGTLVTWGVLLAVAAIAFFLEESEDEPRFWHGSFHSSSKFALAFAFVFMTVSAGIVFLFISIGRIWTADIYVGKANRSNEITESTTNAYAGAIQLYDRESRYYAQLAQVYLALANQEALKKDASPDSRTVQQYLNSAIVSARKAQELSPRDIASVEVLAQVYDTAGLYAPDSFALSESMYRKALELEPHNPDYFLKLGQIKMTMAAQKEEKERRGIWEEAKNLFQSSVEEKDDLAEGHYRLALSREALEDLDGAVKDAARAYMLDSNNINYVFHLGRLYFLRAGEEDLLIAEKLLEQAAAINGAEPNVRLQLGLLYEKLKKPSEAIEQYKKVKELLPKDNEEALKKIDEMIDRLVQS